ncbi:Small nuclear ribonucleoprotein E [Acipenser ruthenus]|uniref:Small nuclear ribonucleoprotein E n=1 Tax=Acipenser ruthenus TaxID=7906 RepID=A0A444UZ09_ACIRT|nr:Small nuclear ribonucleoprotein E [Acipenser ruthenus]
MTLKSSDVEVIQCPIFRCSQTEVRHLRQEVAELERVVSVRREKSTRSRIQVWLYEQVNMRIEGCIIGFDEYMNLVLDDAEEVHMKTKARKTLGNYLSGVVPPAEQKGRTGLEKEIVRSVVRPAFLSTSKKEKSPLVRSEAKGSKKRLFQLILIIRRKTDLR